MPLSQFNDARSFMSFFRPAPHGGSFVLHAVHGREMEYCSKNMTCIQALEPSILYLGAAAGGVLCDLTTLHSVCVRNWMLLSRLDFITMGDLKGIIRERKRGGSVRHDYGNYASSSRSQSTLLLKRRLDEGKRTSKVERKESEKKKLACRGPFDVFTK
jgi:hypothetical protein